jgi:putative ABC transport system permease protein
MKHLPLLWASMRRKPARLVFTLLSVMVAFLLFGILSATREAFVGGVELVGNDRLITIHRISLVQPLPEAYGHRIAGVDGVESVGFANWMQGYYREPRNFIALIAVDRNYLNLYEEVIIPAERREAWARNRTGVVIGKTLAEQYGWRVGDRIPLQSGIFTRRDGGNTYELTVEGIYDSSSRAFDTASAFMHYDYLDEARSFGQGSVGWYIMRIDDPERAPAIAAAVDTLFQNSPAETKTSTEKAFMQGFVNQMGNIGAIVMGIVTAVFFSMLLVTANTMAQSVRERTSELAVLKAVGFTDAAVLGLVLGEAVMITLLGGLAGLGLAYFVAEDLAAGPLAQYFPGFYLTPAQMLLGAMTAVALGLLAGLWPGVQALRLRVSTALRRA